MDTRDSTISRFLRWGVLISRAIFQRWGKESSRYYHRWATVESGRPLVHREDSRETQLPKSKLFEIPWNGRPGSKKALEQDNERERERERERRESGNSTGLAGTILERKEDSGCASPKTPVERKRFSASCSLSNKKNASILPSLLPTSSGDSEAKLLSKETAPDSPRLPSLRDGIIFCEKRGDRSALSNPFVRSLAAKSSRAAFS